MAQTKIQSLNDLNALLDAQEKRIASLEVKIIEMKRSINDVAEENKANTIFIEEDLPFTGLLSKNFFRRAFTIWGHYFVAQLIIAMVLGFAYLLFLVGILNNIVK